MPASILTPAAPKTVLPGVYTVDTLPDPAANMDMYATVSDLFGAKRDKVLASRVGTLAFWQPVRPIFAATLTPASDMTLTPLKSPSVVYLSGTIGTGATRTLTLATAFAFPGASFEVRNNMSGLGTLKIAGLAIGSLLTILTILTNGSQRFYFDAASGWVQFSRGGNVLLHSLQRRAARPDRRLGSRGRQVDEPEPCLCSPTRPAQACSGRPPDRRPPMKGSRSA